MPVDNRKQELSDSEVRAKIEERAATARTAWLRTVGGGFGGTLGAIFAFVALLKFESVALSLMGFVVMGLGYAIVSPEQVITALRKKS